MDGVEVCAVKRGQWIWKCPVDINFDMCEYSWIDANTGMDTVDADVGVDYRTDSALIFLHTDI
jgi:hypothetical protein